MYFDAVLNNDMEPLFNGTPAEVKDWLEKNETDISILVCLGETMRVVSVPEYLNPKK